MLTLIYLKINHILELFYVNLKDMKLKGDFIRK